MNVLLATLGTDGDVFPHVGLGARLCARGHRVTLAANERFRALAAENGLGFLALVSEAEEAEWFGHPDSWHPLKSALVAARVGRGLIRRQYDHLAERARDADVLGANPGVLAARLIQEKLGLPMATILLQPGLLPSVHAPPVMPAPTLPRWAPRPAGWLYWRLVDAVAHQLVGRHLNRIRAALGLRPIQRLFRWWLSPQRVVGLFPAWYAPPPPDWPEHLRLTGFPCYDGRPPGALPAEVRNFCLAGEQPIAFTLGTGVLRTKAFFRAALTACRLLGRRGVLLTKFSSSLPRPLPQSVLHCPFAPFSELFPLCAVVVHHGGIGTVARALAAGTPQLVLPMAWDQFDNAQRVHRLGAGVWLKPRHRTGPRIAEALAGLLSPLARRRCAASAGRFRDEDALEVTAGQVEELASRRNS
jgi:UDP:flavonoid glycosyltransferase YjiC (YdhE family)